MVGIRPWPAKSSTISCLRPSEAKNITLSFPGADGGEAAGAASALAGRRSSEKISKTDREWKRAAEYATRMRFDRKALCILNLLWSGSMNVTGCSTGRCAVAPPLMVCHELPGTSTSSLSIASCGMIHSIYDCNHPIHESQPPVGCSWIWKGYTSQAVNRLS